MENNMEHVPSLVFDWIQQYDFDRLTAKQQQEVVKHLSKEEYSEMYKAAQIVKNNPRVTEAGASRREALLQRFDKKHATDKPIFSLWNQSVTLWKVAATFLLFGMGWQYYLLQQKK